MRSLMTLIFLSVMTISHSQDEFMIENNGLMAFRSFAFYDGNTDNLPATGFGFKINRIVFGTAIADNNPSFSLLYNAFVIETTPGFRQIFQIGASLIFAEYVNVFGGHLNFNQLLPLIPNAPSSLNVGASLYKYNQTSSGWGLSASEYSNTTPTVTFGIKQAIFSHFFIYPVFGASYTITEFDNFKMFSAGINIRFN